MPLGTADISISLLTGTSMASAEIQNRLYARAFGTMMNPVQG
jgi:hypothetical protein